MKNYFENRINKLIFTIVLLIFSIFSVKYSLKKPVYKIKQVTQAVLSTDVKIEKNNLTFQFTVDNKSDFPVFFSFLNLHYTIFFNNNKTINGRYVKYRLNINIGLLEKKDYIVVIDLNKIGDVKKNKIKKVQYWGEMAIQFPMKLYKYKRTKQFEGEKEF